VEDDERSSHPGSHRPDKNDEKVQNLMHSYRCLKYHSYGCKTRFRQRNSEKGMNFCPMTGFSTMTNLQFTTCCQALLAQRSIPDMEHPSCSPDLAPNDF